MTKTTTSKPMTSLHTMTSFPPPPPPSEGETAFINKQNYFASQYSFPTYITASAVCDVSPLLSLLHDLKIESINSTTISLLPTDNRATIDEIRKIVSLCSHYKSTAIQNQKEFEYKRSIIAKEKQNTSTKNIPVQPPYHSDFTPMKPGENLFMSKIHSTNYNLCLASAVCPQRTRSLLSCWKNLDHRVAKALASKGLDQFIWVEEREAVERCIGLSVQKLVKDIIT